MLAKVGDIIKCHGRVAVISKIISQYEDDCYLCVEGEDAAGKYFMWKQRFDGGELIRVTSNEVTGPLIIEKEKSSRVKQVSEEERVEKNKTVDEYHFFLSDDEYNALMYLSSITHIDEWFDLHPDYENGDFITDLEEDNKLLVFKEAVADLYDGIDDWSWEECSEVFQNALIQLGNELNIPLSIEIPWV